MINLCEMILVLLVVVDIYENLWKSLSLPSRNNL